MFGRKQRTADVGDPASALNPYEVATTDPRWVPVPARFPTLQDKAPWDWARRLYAAHRGAGSPAKGDLPFFTMYSDTNGRCAGHDAYWGLLSGDLLPNVTYLMLWFDVSDAAARSAADLQTVLTADRYDGWGRPPLGYLAVPAGPPAVVAVDSARLGAGTCVIRRDLSEQRTTDKHGHADDLFVRPGEDVRFWSFGMSVHWVFEDAATVLHAGLCSGGVGAWVEVGALHHALPLVWQLLDAVGRPGSPPRRVDSDARTEVNDRVSTMLAERGAEEARLAHHHLWNRPRAT